MTFLLKIAYYALFCISGIVGVFYLGMALLNAQPNTGLRERVIMFLASGTALALLYGAFRYGHQQSQWGAGLGMVAGAIFAFVVIMLVGMFTGKIHWQ